MQDENGVQTNFGILDQTMAIEWTYKYISYFGGDPENISISGCSAGGQSVWIHLTNHSPHFKRAIAMKSFFLVRTKCSSR